ncbi:MAG: M28 family peptidase [Acidobacteriaceae bacterium]|nr:M28 family peptidase [Acidobacteriaceae bacterium]
MKILRSLAASVALVSSALAFAQTPIARAEKTISPDRIREYDKFLASDLLEGRYPGLRGGQLAAEYIASQFALYGLKPAGDNGTYMQQVNFVGMKAVPSATHFTFEPAKGAALPLTFGKDFVVSNETLTPSVSFDAPIVFVGFGATAPEYNWDDYAGVDVKGKIILCIVGDPPSTNPKFFGGDALTYYGRWTYKFEQAARKGAIGALIIHRTDYASYGWDVVRNSNAGEKTYLRDDANPRLKAASWIQLEVARKLFAMSGLNLDEQMAAASKPGFKAFELPVHLKATVESTVRRFQSPNIVGILPGANVAAHKPDQAVLYTAHYDHLGIHPDQPGDNIYNGAADNGTGVAMLLESAYAWSQFAKQPGVTLPHSVIFSSVTAEEQGLLGSEYLGQHPPIPADQIALDINYDMLLPIGMQKEINVNGAQRTTFFPQVEATAKRFGLAIVPDPRPSAGSYYRSDHFSLSRVGIPAFSVDSGTLYEGHDRAWGIAQEKDYNDNRYHNFSDNFDPTWDFRGDANLARFGMDLGWQVIHAPHSVEWKHGDEFEPARLASQKK